MLRRSLRVFLIVSVVVSAVAGAGIVHAAADGRRSGPEVVAASAPAGSESRAYVVRAGDSLWAIARRFGVSLPALLAANRLSVTSVIHPGHRLTIPAGAAGPTPSSPSTTAPRQQTPVTGATSYTVRAGDSLYGIARRLGVSLPSLLSANGLTVSSVIHPGQRLAVPAGTAPPTTTPPTTTIRPPVTTTAPPTTTRPPVTTTAPSAPGTYTIRAGDSLFGISRLLGVPFAALLAANGLTANSMIHPGQRLSMPDGTGSAPTTPPPSIPTNTVSAAEVERIIRQVWPDDLEQLAVDIARRESGLRPTAQNACCVGLFQLYYDLHSWWLADLGITTRSALFDARTNAQAALALYRKAGWTPWAVTP